MRYARVCVLGGSGFVGGHLANLLSENGYQVRIPSRHPERHRELLILRGVEMVAAPRLDAATLREHFAGYDAVINLVGILNEKHDDGRGFHAAHVQLARKVVDACRDSGVQRLLHMSALGADARAGASHYLKSKGEAEDLVHEAASEDLQVTSFRPSVIFGPGDSFFSRFATLLKLSPVVFPLACPDSRFAPVYVGDVVHAFLHALEDKATAGQRYDLCGPSAYTLRELVQYAAACAGVHRTIIGLGPRSSRWQARLLELAPGKPFSRDNYRSLQIDSVCGQVNGLEALGITPSSVEAVVPGYLGNSQSRRRYDDYRRQARRG
ncbi:MAG: complex I NDUFA9 subunit family protein [Gammaproteobacteria bacterium]